MAGWIAVLPDFHRHLRQQQEMKTNQTRPQRRKIVSAA
jgi:hypothetical protein